MHGLAVFFFFLKARKRRVRSYRTEKVTKRPAGIRTGDLFAYRANALPTEPQVTVRGEFFVSHVFFFFASHDFVRLAPNVRALELLVSTTSWRSFWNSPGSPGIFLPTPTTTSSIFWKLPLFFQSRAGVTCLTAMVIPRLSKAFCWCYVEN